MTDGAEQSLLHEIDVMVQLGRCVFVVKIKRVLLLQARQHRAAHWLGDNRSAIVFSNGVMRWQSLALCTRQGRNVAEAKLCNDVELLQRLDALLHRPLPGTTCGMRSQRCESLYT